VFHAPSVVLTSGERKRERADIERSRVEFDEALGRLRLAKDKLQRATDVYLERLEGKRADGAKRAT
jgi:hypothetical protein